MGVEHVLLLPINDPRHDWKVFASPTRLHGDDDQSVVVRLVLHPSGSKVSHLACNLANESVLVRKG